VTAAPRRASIEASLMQVAARIGDPSGLVYARLFAAQPAMLALFCNDKSGSVRGEMLARAFDTILDFVGDHGYARHLLRAERDNHAGYGVEPAVFMTFFDVIFGALEGEMAGHWSAEVRQTWGEMLAEMRVVLDDPAWTSVSAA
jgi:hemoglobin-like flavoprotein